MGLKFTSNLVKSCYIFEKKDVNATGLMDEVESDSKTTLVLVQLKSNFVN